MIVVDPIREYSYPQIKGPARRFGRRWCHLEDTENDLERLHAFAKSIGIPRRWFQIGARGTHPHYDLTPRYRLRAVAAGAVELTLEQAHTRTWKQAEANRHFPKGDPRYGKKTAPDGHTIGVFAQPRRLRSAPETGTPGVVGDPETRSPAPEGVPKDSGQKPLPLDGWHDD